MVKCVVGAEVRCSDRGMSHTRDGRGGGDNTQAEGWALDCKGKERLRKAKAKGSEASACLPARLPAL